MSAIPDGAVHRYKQLVADLRRQLAESEGRAQQGAAAGDRDGPRVHSSIDSSLRRP